MAAIIKDMEAVAGGRSVVYRVTERDQGRRLDLFLKERIPKMSRRGVQRAILERVAVAGRTRARASTALRAGDEVIVTWPLPEDARDLDLFEGPAPSIL